MATTPLGWRANLVYAAYQANCPFFGIVRFTVVYYCVVYLLVCICCFDVKPFELHAFFV